MRDNEEFRFGSAGWADEDDLRAAGLFRGAGLPIGYYGRLPLHLEGDAPLLTIGGAGSGKLRDLLGYVVCCSPGMPMLILDPRGEMREVSHVAHAHHRGRAYGWDPVGITSQPQNRINPLDILKLDCANLHGDCAFIAEGLVPLSGGGNGRYFELRARDWIANILKADVEQKGGTDFARLGRIVNAIESDPQLWAAFLEGMLESRFESVRRSAGEMLKKQQDTPKEFGSILGEIYSNLAFMNDPVLMCSLEQPDVSLEDLCTGRAHKVFLNVPAEYLGIWSPIIRVMFTVAMLYKARNSSAPRLTMLVDEAGQLGRFEALLRSFTYGRGAGVRSWALFQDVGQIKRNFDAAALQGFMGSAQMRQFFGVRDYETAKMVSDMLGSETLQFDDTLRQQEATRRKRQIAMEIMEGGDPFQAAYDFAHFQRAAQHRSVQARQLMTPDEVLALGEDEQILFISGKNLKPILANKYPYYTRREMAGLYLPNPHHPPVDRVRIQTLFGKRWRRVISEPVPQALASFPQYQDGTLSYVEGFKP